MGKKKEVNEFVGRRESHGVNFTANVLLIIASLLCVIPFLIVVSASLSNEGQIALHGYSLLPRGLTLNAYKIIFSNGEIIIRAYLVTIVTTALGSVLSILIQSLAAYPLSRTDYKWRNAINLFIYFPMIFSGGAVSSYLWITQGLHLRNNPLVLILPNLMSASNVFLLRTYMSKIPHEMIESARIDGAGELRIFSQFIVPLTKVGIVTVLVMTILGFWNQWYAPMMYMNDDKYITIQYYMMRVLENVEAMLDNQNTMGGMVNMEEIPSESTRMSLCVLAAGPMVFVFSFFQKYFAGGIALGSVKG